MTDLRSEIDNVLIPAHEARLAAAIGEPASIKIDWESVDASPNKEVATQALYSFKSYFVLERLTSCVERLCKEGGPESLQGGKIKSIEIQNQNDDDKDWKPVVYTMGVLRLRGKYHLGAFGGFERFKLRRALETLTDFRSRFAKKEWYERTIPTFDRRMKEDLKATLEIEVDWDSFSKGGNSDGALSRISCWYGSYSTWPIYYALNSLKGKDDISSEDVFDVVKKIRIANVPGDDETKKTAFVKDGVLHYVGVWEDWSGTFSWYQLEQIVHEAILFQRLKPFKQLNPEKQKAKIEFLEKVATNPNTVLGHWEHIAEIAQHPAFWQPDPKLKECMLNALKQFHEGEEGAPEYGGERFIQGWHITKINYRGQEQARLMVLTEKAMYTFKYDFGKNQIDAKHSKRMDHQDYDYVRWVELTAPQGGGALGAVAAVASIVAGGPARWGFRYITNKKKKSGGLMGAAPGAAAIVKKLFELARKMIHEQVETKTDLPELRIPKLPNYTAASIIDIVFDNLKSVATVPMVNLTNSSSNTVSAGLLDALTLIKECMDDLAKQPPVKLTNVPSITIPMVLLTTIDIMENMQDVNLSMPDTLNVGAFLRQIIDFIKSAKDVPSFKLPPPTPVTLQVLLQAIKDAVTNEKDLEVPAVDLPGFPAMPSVPEIIDQICEQVASAGLPEITFPEFPELNFLETLEKLAGALSGVSFPNFDLPKVDLPGLPMPAIPGGALIGMLKGPSAPTWVELTCEPILPEGDKEFNKVISQEMCWFLYGCVRAATRPYYQSYPWESSHTLPAGGPTVTVYNKLKMGKDNAPTSS